MTPAKPVDLVAIRAWLDCGGHVSAVNGRAMADEIEALRIERNNLLLVVRTVIEAIEAHGLENHFLFTLPKLRALLPS